MSVITPPPKLGFSRLQNKRISNIKEIKLKIRAKRRIETNRIGENGKTSAFYRWRYFVDQGVTKTASDKRRLRWYYTVCRWVQVLLLGKHRDRPW
jgi:hypothetical protein